MSLVDPMNPEVKAEWIERLRAGNLKQGVGRLRTEEDKYCCLGVLSEIAVEKGVIPPPKLRHNSDGGMVYYYGQRYCGSVTSEYEGSSGALVLAVQEWSGIKTRAGDLPVRWVESLATLNDDGLTFDQIADVIEWIF